MTDGRGPRPRIGRDHLLAVAAILAEHRRMALERGEPITAEAIDSIVVNLADLYATAIGPRFDAGRFWAVCHQ